MAKIFDGVNVAKLNGNLNEGVATEDNVIILLYAIASGKLPGSVAHNTAYELKQAQDAVDLGFTAAHDANESIWVLGAIQEYFSYAPEAVLWLIPVEDGNNPAEILALAAVKAAIRNADKGHIMAR